MRLRFHDLKTSSHSLVPLPSFVDKERHEIDINNYCAPKAAVSTCHVSSRAFYWLQRYTWPRIRVRDGSIRDRLMQEQANRPIGRMCPWAPASALRGLEVTTRKLSQWFHVISTPRTCKPTLPINLDVRSLFIRTSQDKYVNYHINHGPRYSEEAASGSKASPFVPTRQFKPRLCLVDFCEIKSKRESSKQYGRRREQWISSGPLCTFICATRPDQYKHSPWPSDWHLTTAAVQLWYLCS